MRTGTAATRQATSQVWNPVLRAAGGEASELGEQILAVAHQVAVSRLASPLTDPGRDGQDKAELAANLLRGKVDDRVVELTQALVRGRWSAPVDLLTALHDFGIEALLAGARAAGTVADIEQELFAAADVIGSDRQLRQALDPARSTTTEARVRLARRVFGSQLSAPALSLLTWCVRHRTEGGTLRNLRRVTELAAAMREHVIADVTTATPMTTAQEERLARLLTERFGAQVDLNTVVDPAVVGGVRVQVGDQVIDSTVSTTLTHLRAQLAG